MGEFSQLGTHLEMVHLNYVYRKYNVKKLPTRGGFLWSWVLAGEY